MIEMVVRAVEQCPRSGQPVAVLEARAAAIYPRLVLTVTPGEAHALVHELRHQETLRAQAFGLLVRVLAGVRGKLSAAEIRPARGRLAMARLRLECPSGKFRVPIEVGQAIGLAVQLNVPLLASRGLFSMLATREPPTMADHRHDVPEPFRRAFGE
jgi:hypothetical protein